MPHASYLPLLSQVMKEASRPMVLCRKCYRNAKSFVTVAVDHSGDGGQNSFGGTLEVGNRTFHFYGNMASVVIKFLLGASSWVA